MNERTPAQLDMLAALWRLHQERRGWLSLGMITRATGRTNNSAAHLLTTMVSRGDVLRGHGSGHTIYRLTEQGTDTARALAGPAATPEQIRDLAGTIAAQAQAIADGAVVGPVHGAVRRLARNTDLLLAWQPDDRSQAAPAAAAGGA